MNVHGYNLTATVYSAAGPGETLNKIVTALAEAGMVAEGTAVTHHANCCEHIWRLVETGYVRSWHTEIDEGEGVIRAFYGGSDDFSELGAGDDHLECSLCLETKSIPDDWEVDYQ